MMWISSAFAQTDGIALPGGAAAAAPAAAAPAAAAPNPLVTMIPMVLVFMVFYFFLIRPQMTARKKHQEAVSNVRRGDVVVTGGGLVGKITKVVDDDEVTVELAENVSVRVVKSSIAQIRTGADAGTSS